jgi:hypothetical protein
MALLPLVALIATFGIACLMEGPGVLRRLSGLLLVGLIPLQFAWWSAVLLLR